MSGCMRCRFTLYNGRAAFDVPLEGIYCRVGEEPFEEQETEGNEQKSTSESNIVLTRPSRIENEERQRTPAVKLMIPVVLIYNGFEGRKPIRSVEFRKHVWREAMFAKLHASNRLASFKAVVDEHY